MAPAVIDWLRRPLRDSESATPIEPRTIVVAGRELPLVVRRLRHARRMTLRLSPDGREARVSIPAWGRLGDALQFARDRSDWLAQQLDRLPPAQSLTPGATLAYRGETLRIAWLASAPRRPVLDDGAVVIGGPSDGLHGRIARWLEAEAMRLIADDLEHYCRRANHPVPRLALSRAQRRWGSCASDGTIRINWRLVMAPDFVRRSVVAHEVAHLSHFDHSPAFHAELGRLFEGRIEDANRWLKREGRALYRAFG